jgi:hypothetical protein
MPRTDSDDRRYFSDRADVEWALAEQAGSLAARQTHRTLAERYEALAVSGSRETSLTRDIAGWQHSNARPYFRI